MISDASLAQFVSNEAADVVASFADALAAGRVTLASGAARLRMEFVNAGRSVERMLELLSAWAAIGGDERSLALSVASALSVRTEAENRGPRCELVWSGSKLAGAGVRSTFPVILEMLDGARRSVVVMSYSLWLGGDDTTRIIERIAELSSQGVDVTIIMDHRYQAGGNVQQVKRAWPSSCRHAVLFDWSDKDDEIAKLHAKVLLVDARDLLITSANLTGHGMRQNLEFGLRVMGRPAADAAAHIDHLIRSGVFREVPWL